MQDTLTTLAQHHVDGQKFMQVMKDTAANRFDDAFWAVWADWISPVLSEPPQIADFGSGPGMLLQKLYDRYPQAHLIGVECAPWMLAELDKSRYKVIEHDLHEANLPIADNSLDAIIAIFVIHEMTQPIQLLQSIHRCLKPGGRCLIVDWVRVPLDGYIASEATEDIFDSNTSHDTLSNIFTHFMEHNRYSRDDVAWMLQRMGFSVLENAPLQKGRFGQWIVEK
ncbi:Methyltransferase type 11 domain protein [Candidatus Thiomargarita nelsonii]|uniref:Methyltransferase type 11 domain protein n=1 Tax=Candidatus Thiomargarita nelsonii TaxID=1003181 RepID=A0A176S695_9GAMM|nr:Methyltransferase type 11 domain protein [Candidatus Thiomargarita nelsonii]